MIARLVWLSVSAVLLSLVCVVHPSQSSAYVPEPVVLENIPAIADHVARGGATSIPGVDCGSRCADWWVQEHRPIPNQPSSEQLHRELRTLRSKPARVLPQLRHFGRISLAVGAFYVGWKIGEGLNTKLLKIGIPEPPPPYTGGYPGLAYSLVYKPTDGKVYSNILPVPEGWVVQWNDADPETSDGYGFSADPDICSGPPPGFGVSIGHDPSYGTWDCFWPHTPPWNEQFHVVIPGENSLEGRGAIEDYVGQPYDRETQTWTDAPQSRQELETRTRGALENGEYRMAEAWYAEQLDPRNHDTATEHDEDCDLSSGTGEDPGLDRGTGDTGEEFRQRYDKVPTAVYPADGFPAIKGTAYLRWGVTSPNTDNAEIDWRGWGYRKIRAKHGWGPDDVEATRIALLDPLPSEDLRVPDRWVYQGPEYGGRRTARCVREVVVEHARNQKEIDEGVDAPGIITSFGRRIN